ncbi:MAG: autotransporter-associated beta strand repeat-containing protein, partial [Thermoguttaceae bacterium]
MNLGKIVGIAVLFGLLGCAAASGFAQQTLYWDPTGTHSSNGSGSGTWDTNTTADWWISGSTESTWTDVTGNDTAVFGGPAGTYTVTVAGNNTANALTFNTPGYTLSNGTVTIAGFSPTITSNAPATIGSLFTVGTDGISFAGSGSLTLAQPLIPFALTPSYTASVAIPVQVSSGTLTMLGNAYASGYSQIQISSGAVVQSAATLNLLSYQQAQNSHAEDVTGAGGTGANAGTLQLVGTGGSLANPDIVFAPDHSGNAYDGVLIGNQQDIADGTIGLTLDLGSRQRYIVGNSGHNSVSNYYGSGTAPDCQIIANIIGSGGITYYAGSEYGGLYAELVLSGSNSFSGPVEVDRGAIFLDNASALSGSNTVTLSNSDSTYSRLFLFGNNATVTNLQSTGATPGYTGVANANPTTNENPATPVTNPVTLTVNETANTTFAGTIADALSDGYDGGSAVPGPLGLTKTGPATLTLTNTSNSYSGATTVSAGILSIGKLALGGSASSIGTSTNVAGNLVLAGGTLQYTGGGDSTDRLFSLDAAGGAIDASGTGPVNWTNSGAIAFGSDPAPSGTRTLTLTGSNTGLNMLAAVVADDAVGGFPTALTKTGPGTWVLTASNTYTGPTTVQQGLLEFPTGSGLAGALVVNGGTASTNDTFTASSATVRQGLLQMSDGNTLNGPLAVSGGTAILDGTLTATAATVQNGLLQLIGGSSLHSPLSLSGGTLFVNNLPSAGPTPTTTISSGLTVSSPSTLNLQAGTSWNPSVALLSGTGSLTVNSAATINLASFGSLSVGDYPLIELSGGTINGTLGFSGLTLGSLPSRVQGKLVASDQGGTEILDLDVTSFDTIKWSGSVSNTWDTTTMNWLTVSNNTPTTYIQQPTGDTVTFDDSAKTGTVNIPSLVQPTAVTVNNNTLSYTFSSSSGTGGISGNAPLVKSGSGSLMVLTNNSYSGGTIINGGTVTLGNGATPGFGSITGNVSLDNTATGTAVLQFNRPDSVTFPGNITGSGSLVQAGSGTTILSGVSTYNGSTLVSNGALQIGNGGVNGMIPLSNIVNNAALIFDRSDLVTLVNTISGTGTTYVNGGTLQLGDGTNIGSINGPIVTNATLALALAGSTATYSGVISGGSGGVALATAVVGNQTLSLTASNGYTGPTYIGSGYLIFGNVANIGSLSGTGNLILDGGTAEYTGSSGTAAHGLTVGAGGATVQIDNASQTLGMLGPVTGSGGLTLPGPGSLTVGSVALGSQPYSKPYLSAPLQINGGTLMALGNVNASNNSPIIIAAGAVMQSAATLNLLAYQAPSGHSLDITGSGTLQLVGTGGSIANPDIFFGPDHQGNAYDGVAIDSGLTINLGGSQRYIDANSGHNSVAHYYSTLSFGSTSGNCPDAVVDASIIGSGGITFYAVNRTSNLYAELVLSGSNSFSGPVEVDQGSIFLDNPLALSQSNAVTLSNSSTDSLSVSHLFLFGNSTM